MYNIEIKNIEHRDSVFLCKLMKNCQIMQTLNEPPTSQEDWTGAVNC